MLLTGFSRSVGREVDTEQMFSYLANRDGNQSTTYDEKIPDSWRDEIRRDIECPSCFATGAEVAKVPAPAFVGQSKRRWCFQFSYNEMPSKHFSGCDFVGTKVGRPPKDIVKFDTSRTMVHRGIRELAAKAIRLGVIDYGTARGLREWMFNLKKKSRLLVTLDPRVPKWIQGIRGSLEIDENSLPYEVELTKRVVGIPGFDWQAAAVAAHRNRHRALFEILLRERLWLHGLADRIESLATIYQGRYVLDRISVRAEYEQALGLATFISTNCSPIKYAPGARKSAHEPGLLAFAALLLYAAKWDLGAAIDKLAIIMNSRSCCDDGDELLNFTSVNPFDNYEAWNKLKRLQELSGFLPGKLNLRVELIELERQLRASFS